MASKHYEQNKNSLSNYEIYQLCQHCCVAIERKISHRITIRHKKYAPPITSCTVSLIEPIFSMSCLSSFLFITLSYLNLSERTNNFSICFKWVSKESIRKMYQLMILFLKGSQQKTSWLLFTTEGKLKSLWNSIWSFVMRFSCTWYQKRLIRRRRLDGQKVFKRYSIISKNMNFHRRSWISSLSN